MDYLAGLLDNQLEDLAISVFDSYWSSFIFRNYIIQGVVLSGLK